MRLAWSFEPRMLPQIQRVQKSGQAGFQIAELMVKLRHMSDIIIIRNHTLSLKKARIAAEHVAVDLENKFDLTCIWGEDGVLNFERPGVNGQLSLAKHEVSVTVSLGMFFMPFRAVLEAKIHEYFDKRFA